MGILDAPGYSRAQADIQSGRPSAAIAAGALKQYEQRRAAYNFKPSNTRKLRAGLGKAKAGTGSVKIAFAGDSTSAGYPGLHLKAAPIIFRDMLESAGYPVMGTGPVIANPGGAPGAFYDARYTTTGTWTTQASNPNGIRQSNVVGSTITFTSDRPGTIVEFCVLGLGAGYTYQIDGGANVAVTDASTGALSRKTVTGLANTTHTLKITVDSIPGGGAFYLAWVDVRVATSGVLVGNFGVNSTTATHWIDGNFYFPGRVVSNWVPDVTLIDLGINDDGAAHTTAQFKGELQTLITTYKAFGDVILVTSNPFEGKTYDAYNKAKYELADTNDIPLIDIYEVFESYTVSNPLGLYSDAAHPSAAGYAVKGAALFRALT